MLFFSEKNLTEEIEMPRGTVEDKDDILIENLNTILFLFLGILSVFTSLILFVYSATVTVYSQQLSMNFLITSVFAALLFVIGLGSLNLFRKRRKLRKKKTAALF